MRTRTISIVMAVLGLVAAVAHSTAAEPSDAGKGDQKVLTLPHRSTTLENGLNVFLVKYPSPGVVAYQIGVRVGSRNEIDYGTATVPGKTGFAHFFEHLMFRGTKSQSAEEFNDVFVRNGVRFNAWTSTDMTNYHGEVASVYLDAILAVEADRFMNLHFDEAALQQEAGAVVGEYNKIATPDFVLEEKLREAAFKKHPYGHTTMGYKRDIDAYHSRYEAVWPFFKRYYRPSNVRIVLVGDIDFDAAIGSIRDKFGGWKNPELAEEVIPREPEQTQARREEVAFPSPAQTRITVAYKVPAFTTRDSEAAALQLLAEAYFSETSEFQKTFRFEKGWLDAVSAYPTESIDPGLWQIDLRLSASGKSKEAEILAAVSATVERARTETIPAERLQSTKERFLNAALTGGYASPDALASLVNWYLNFEPDLDVLERHFGRIRETSAETIRAFAAETLTEARSTTVILRGNE